MEFSSFFNNPRVTTVGTSYYHSSLHYLGYSPYNDPNSMESGDVKPNILWVSPALIIVHFFFLPPSLSQLSYSTNPIGLFLTVRHCLNQEMKIVNQVSFNFLLLWFDISPEVEALQLSLYIYQLPVCNTSMWVQALQHDFVT